MANSDIVNYLAGKSVFITGGTGFLGKVLVEKLLRCCPDIQRIYLLMRAKAGSDINARLEQLVDNKVHPPQVFFTFQLFSPNFVEEKKVAWMHLHVDFCQREGKWLSVDCIQMMTWKNEISSAEESGKAVHVGSLLRRIFQKNEGTDEGHLLTGHFHLNSFPPHLARCCFSTPTDGGSPVSCV